MLLLLLLLLQHSHERLRRTQGGAEGAKVTLRRRLCRVETQLLWGWQRFLLGRLDTRLTAQQDGVAIAVRRTAQRNRRLCFYRGGQRHAERVVGGAAVVEERGLRNE